MKNVIAILLIVLLTVPAYAGINKQLTEVAAINILKNSKNSAGSVSKSMVALRQSIEDKLANQLSNLDAGDQTKLTALITEIQDIINAADDLVTKINTHYPEVN